MAVDTKEDGNKVLIHFDGWTARYDYWTVTTDPELHPIGYVAHLQSIGHNQKLSPYGGKG